MHEDFPVIIKSVMSVPIGEQQQWHIDGSLLSVVVVVRWSNDLDAIFIMLMRVEVLELGSSLQPVFVNDISQGHTFSLGVRFVPLVNFYNRLGIPHKNEKLCLCLVASTKTPPLSLQFISASPAVYPHLESHRSSTGTPPPTMVSSLARMIGRGEVGPSVHTII
jgi:hypothetical protein